jgi:aminopeptidase-like protein
MDKLHHINLKYKSRCWNLLEKLFPIYRTILGEGFQKSLDIISNIIPISILEYPSGSKCGSWTIPDEWIIKNAYIKDNKGKIILSHQENPFYVWQYSIPFSGNISKDELKNHINIEKNNNYISSTVAYYSNNWGFNMSLSQYNNLKDENYYVEIDTEFRKSVMRIGELYLSGYKEDEIIIDSVLSSPSLANNLSGVVAAVFVADLINGLKNRNFSYRILFTPETIGPIAMHYIQSGFGQKVIGGYNLVNLAYGTQLNYKKSRTGDTIADIAMEHSLENSGKKYSVNDYDVLSGTCGNEKAYNSLGIDIPIGSFQRSPLGSYPEYDTDHDNLNFIDQDTMFESLKICWGAIQTIERSKIYKHKFEGEPFLTGYGLYPNIKNEIDRIPFDYLMGFTDGNMSLVEIAKKAGISITEFDNAVNLMLRKGLIDAL